MIRFTLGLIIFALTIVMGGYMYFQNLSIIESRRNALATIQEEKEDGIKLKERIKNIRKMSTVSGDDQKFTIERTIGIGAPGLELKFIGQPRTAGGSRAMYRHTFRITGPATFQKSLDTVRKISVMPGFAIYKYCYACAQAPKDTPENEKMVQIEGYLYVYDPNIL